MRCVGGIFSLISAEKRMFMPMRNRVQYAPFNLLAWFAWISPLIICLIALANAWLISSFLNNHLFLREAYVSRDFVQNMLVFDGGVDYLSDPEQAGLKVHFQESVAHLSNMPDIPRANIFGKNGVILWSTDAQLIGKAFPGNDELEEAMHGELVVHAGEITNETRQKPEHVGLDKSVQFFVETYIPVISPETKQVVGVVELYKTPLALSEAIREGRVQVGLSALGSALALYFGLFWLIRRADRTIKLQSAELVDAQTMAVIGELTSSVAHNIRNPLSSIRSSAELSLELSHEDCSEQARDIIREVDRISGRITELLRLSGKDQFTLERVDMEELLQTCVADHREAFQLRSQTLSLECATTKHFVSADAALLRQVFHSLLSNASEAMVSGGVCRIGLVDGPGDRLKISVEDDGEGVKTADASALFRPFFTTKPKGLGLGLPFAKRIVERFDGSIELESLAGQGTSVHIFLPRA
jgi:two-component system, NtrC family, sensor histidine kinase HydH